MALQPVARQVTHQYLDPLELIWINCAKQLGILVQRSTEVYASWDGKQTLTLSTADDFDADDSLAQLIYHEICHALVSGPRGFRLPDWGLSNTDDSDLVYEHACHRLQAALAQPFGLRQFFAVTTEWRPYWDELPDNPLQAYEREPSADGPSERDPAIPIALEAYRRSQLEPTRSVLQRALEQTAQLAAIIHQNPVPEGSLWSTVKLRHESGLLRASTTVGTCGQCAWAYGGAILRCRRSHAESARRATVKPGWPGCEHFEPAFDEGECRSCAACCRQGYDRVELRRGDTIANTHPELVSVDDKGIRHLARPEGLCVALNKDADYRCKVYVERPKACAELLPRGDACLWARRRVGLTR
jgi:hypothetical protein